MVSPGTYQARLTVGDWSEVRSFEAMMDPRVLAEGVTAADIEAQAKLGLQVRDTLSSARRAADQLKKAEEGATGTTAESLAEIRKQLLTAPVRYSQPMLIDQLEYLNGNISRADQAPGADALARFEELDAALKEQVRKLHEVLGEK